MKILGMGAPELLIILVVVLLIFGPKNLPKLGSAIGKSMKGLREGLGSARRPKRRATRKRSLRILLSPSRDTEERRHPKSRRSAW